jgi:hypothetical protein
LGGEGGGGEQGAGERNDPNNIAHVNKWIIKKI